MKVGQSFHFITRCISHVLASWKPPSSTERYLTLLFFNMHYNITEYTVNLFKAWPSNSWKQYKHINRIVMFQPLYIVVELVALHSWLLLRLIAYFKPFVSSIKTPFKSTREDLFVVLLPILSLWKTGTQLLYLHTAQHGLLDNVDIMHNECTW